MLLNSNTNAKTLAPNLLRSAATMFVQGEGIWDPSIAGPSIAKETVAKRREVLNLGLCFAALKESSETNDQGDK